jgi:thioredoxin-like negative regulator of GroEL
MIDINTEEEFEIFIKNNEAALIYFSTPQCNVCKVLKPKILNFVKSEFGKVKMGYVDMESIPSISAQNQIFTVPTILVYLGGKEFLRKSRNISLDEFRKELERPYSLYFEEG